jgi:hypothetical protein
MRISPGCALRLAIHGLSAAASGVAILSCGIAVSFDEYGRGHGRHSPVVDAGPGSPIPTDATLASLTISGGALTPAFQPTTLDYTMHIRSRGVPPGGTPVALSQTMITATATHPDAHITIAAKPVPSGSTNGPLGLALGDNPPLDITVTSPDGQTHVHYAVAISVAKSHDYLKASESHMGAAFSRGALALSGDTLAVGNHLGGPNTPGGQPSGGSSLFVFTRTETVWSQQANLDANLGDSDAASVALEGDTLAVLFQSATVRVFRRSGSAWSTEATLDLPSLSEDPFDQAMFGSIALSGATLAVGANDVKGSSVYVFTNKDGSWSQQASLHLPLATPPGDPNMAPLPPIPGPGMSLPVSVALSGHRLALGVPNDWSSARGIDGDRSNMGAEASGAVHVFTRAGATWSEEAYVKASNTRAYARFGNAVALSGTTLVVGSTGESSNATGVNGDQSDMSSGNSGAVYVFSRSPTAWAQQAYLKPTATSAQTRPESFGQSLALHGDILAVGAPADSGGGRDAAGAVFAFMRKGSTWSLYAYLQAPNPFPFDSFGNSIAVSADTLVVGSPFDKSNATGINGDELNQGAPGSGAVHVF